MDKFAKPAVFISKCLGFAKCRWNGDVIPDKFVEMLKPHVTVVTACPESDIGLGVPRDPIRIIREGEKYRLCQLNTGRDVTSEMERFARDYVKTIGEVDGFILKDRSPSCGMKDVKVYRGLEPGSSIGKTSGFFAKEVMEKFGYLAVETEMRLTNFSLREHFLTRIFLGAAFRELSVRPSMEGLVRFHSDNKFLLMSYDQKGLKDMGRIVANHGKYPLDRVFSEYSDRLYRTMSAVPRYTSNINVLTHAMGYFSKGISPQEKKFFLNTLEEYRREQVPLSVPLSVIRSYIVRFGEEYLARQSFFAPYPPEFLMVRDSGKGRDL